jgi:hypothetical protein
LKTVIKDKDIEALEDKDKDTQRQRQWQRQELTAHIDKDKEKHCYKAIKRQRQLSKTKMVHKDTVIS